MKTCHLLSICLAASVISPTLPASEKTPPKFYAYCIEVGVPKVKARPLAEQAKLLRELGYAGMGLPLALTDELEANLKTLDDTGLQAFMFWASVNVNPAKAAAPDPRLLAAIRKLKSRPATVSVLLGGLKPGDPQGMEPAVKTLRELGDAAAEAGARISIYNHVNNWTESLPFIIEVVRKANHPQVGFNFNLCHWLKVDGTKDYRPLLRENAAKLFCVTINGAQIGATTWTNGLIQPLDKGDFDNRALLATLNEIGYRGPVGLMCYGVPDDPREHLTRSMNVWKRWQTAAPKPAKATETDARLHADGKGWRLDKAKVTDTKRPRVLLIGDSILNGYLKCVTALLDGKAYVDAWVNPYCQSEHLNKTLLPQVLDHGPYDVVHFNMGLHGWPEGRIKPGTFEPLTKGYVEVLRAKLPKARLIWASSTPVTKEKQPTELEPDINPIIIEHNRMAAKVMVEMNVPVNDFYALLVNKRDLARGDRFHWTAPAYELLAKTVVESVLRELKMFQPTQNR